MTLRIAYEGVNGARLHIAKYSNSRNSAWLTRNHTCPLCLETFNLASAVAILITGGRDVFPGCVVHQKCITELGAHEDDYAPLFNELQDSYTRYKTNADRKRWEGR